MCNNGERDGDHVRRSRLAGEKPNGLARLNLRGSCTSSQMVELLAEKSTEGNVGPLLIFQSASQLLSIS